MTASGGWQIAIAALDDADAFDLPYEFGRTGDSEMGAVRLDSGLLRVALRHEGEGNFIVQLYRADGRRVGTLANEIGSYTGAVAERIPSVGVYYLDVQADGPWSIRLEQ